MCMKSDILKVLYTEEEIQQKVKEIGQQISEDYKDKNPIIVAILKGSIIFMADLLKNITIHTETDFMAVSSYGESFQSTGIIKILKDLSCSIKGKDVIILEDILDSGNTLSYLKSLLEQRGPSSVKIVTLFNKPEGRQVPVYPDYIGFNIPNEFVVGYGLDYNEKYRNLSFVGVLNPEVYKKA